MIKVTPTFQKDQAIAAKTALNGGFLVLFKGTMPADASVAVPTGAVALATITESGDGVTGLTFDTPTTGTISMTSTETWTCLGADVSSGTPTFYRWVMGSDDGTGAAGATDVRVQGTVGTDPNVHDLVLAAGAATLVSGTDLPIVSFSYSFPSAA